MSGETTFKIETADHHSLVVSDRGAGGLPVLFMNSVAADHSMWDAVRRLMSRRSVAYDARGHGGSDVTPGTVTVTDLARDALAVMDATGLDRAVICGLSLGGMTAMKLAALAPDRVAGLVLANTASSRGPCGRLAQSCGANAATLGDQRLARRASKGHAAPA
jgi:3-oxoadipate enol-lactonase